MKNLENHCLLDLVKLNINILDKALDNIVDLDHHWDQFVVVASKDFHANSCCHFPYPNILFFSSLVQKIDDAIYFSKTHPYGRAVRLSLFADDRSCESGAKVLI